ncbi:MAG: hypothetical protein IPI39_23140 [Candidatus Obscuribacter sp.]|nr:hypothetical protein [Candidatus Obscuribacter sp.]
MLSSALAVNPSGHMLADRFELGQEIGRGGMGDYLQGIDHKQSDPDKAAVAIRLLVSDAANDPSDAQSLCQRS